MDLGSGKGYLSQCLALQYGLKVVGVDSSDGNTQNAARRNERLLKVWSGLVKKSKRENNGTLRSDTVLEASPSCCDGSLHLCNHFCEDSDKKRALHRSSSSLSSSPQGDSRVTCKGSSDAVHRCLYSENDMTGELKQSYTCVPNLTSFVPVTGFVDQSYISNGTLTRIFDELGTPSDGENIECNGMFIVGLHTCGDLAPTALRIFSSESSVKLICIVGCCYHLVTQEVGGKKKFFIHMVIFLLKFT